MMVNDKRAVCSDADRELPSDNLSVRGLCCSLSVMKFVLLTASSTSSIQCMVSG